MSNVLIDQNKLDILATAISNKSGEPLKMTLAEMVEAVDGIEGGITPTGNIDITGAGVTDVTNYATATVPQGEINVSADTGFYTQYNVYRWHFRPFANIKTSDYAGKVGFLADNYYKAGNNQIFSAIASGTSVTPTETAQSIGGAEYMMEGAVTVNPIPSQYIIPTGTKSITQNGTGIDVTEYASVDVNVSGGSDQIATGTFTGNGTRQVTVSCNFEPDFVYWTCDPGTSASSGTVACMIARGMMAANRYRNNATTNSANIQTPITAMNTGGSSYNFRATYANSTVTLYSFSTAARNLFTNGRVYTYTFIKWT